MYHDVMAMGRPRHNGRRVPPQNTPTLEIVPFTEEQIQRISEHATPDVLAPVPPEVSEVAHHIVDVAFDAYTEDDWRYVLNALRPDRAAAHISSRPPEDHPELLLLIEPNRRAAVERHLTVFSAAERQLSSPAN